MADAASEHPVSECASRWFRIDIVGGLGTHEALFRVHLIVKSLTVLIYDTLLYLLPSNIILTGWME